MELTISCNKPKTKCVLYTCVLFRIKPRWQVRYPYIKNNYEGIKNPDGSITGIKDASGVKKTGGTLELSILSDSEDGNPSDELISAFKKYINRDDVKVWNDTIEVAKISTIGVEIKAQARPVYGTQIDLSKIKEKFI